MAVVLFLTILIGLVLNIINSFVNYTILVTETTVPPIVTAEIFAIIFSVVFIFFGRNVAVKYIPKKDFYKVAIIPISLFVAYSIILTVIYTDFYKSDREIQKAGNYIARTVSSMEGDETELTKTIKPFFLEVIEHQKLDASDYDIKITQPTKKHNYGQPFIVQIKKNKDYSLYPYIVLTPINKPQEWLFFYVFVNKSFDDETTININDKKIEKIIPYN